MASKIILKLNGVKKNSIWSMFDVFSIDSDDP